MADAFSSLIRMLELRLKRQEEALSDTKAQLAEAYKARGQSDLAGPKK